MFGPDLEKYDLVVIDEGTLREKYKKTNLLINDFFGAFGSPRFSYTIYRNESEHFENGGSKLYLMVHTPKSYQNMREELRRAVKDKMHERGIDIDRAVREHKIVMAIDRRGLSVVQRDSLFVVFAPPPPKKVEERRYDGEEEENW